MGFNVRPDTLTIDGIPVPILICDRETVLYYFNIVHELENTDQEQFPNAYKELRNRVMRLRMAMYYPCEETGELRLLSSLCEFEGKIVFTRVKRSIIREREKLVKQEERKMKKQEKQDLKLKEQEARKQHALSKRGKTRLECALIDGRITQADLDAIDKTLTEEDFRKEFESMQKSGSLSFVKQDRLPKVLAHNIWLDRIDKMIAEREAKKFLGKS